MSSPCMCGLGMDTRQKAGSQMTPSACQGAQDVSIELSCDGVMSTSQLHDAAQDRFADPDPLRTGTGQSSPRRVFGRFNASLSFASSHQSYFNPPHIAQSSISSHSGAMTLQLPGEPSQPSGEAAEDRTGHDEDAHKNSLSQPPTSSERVLTCDCYAYPDPHNTDFPPVFRA